MCIQQANALHFSVAVGTYTKIFCTEMRTLFVYTMRRGGQCASRCAPRCAARCAPVITRASACETSCRRYRRCHQRTADNIRRRGSLLLRTSVWDILSACTWRRHPAIEATKSCGTFAKSVGNALAGDNAPIDVDRREFVTRGKEEEEGRESRSREVSSGTRVR